LDALALHVGLEIPRIEEVVLDGVARAVIWAFSKPRIERTICTCTSNGRLVEIPFG
jgi:hypothetical protein